MVIAVYGAQEAGVVAPANLERGVVRFNVALERVKCLFEESLGVGVAALEPVVDREVVERQRGFRMVGTEVVFLDSECSLIELFGFAEPAASMQRRREVVEVDRDLLVMGPEYALEDLDDVAEDDFGAVVFAERVENRCVGRSVLGDCDVGRAERALTGSNGGSGVRFGGCEVAASVLEPTQVVVDRGDIAILRLRVARQDCQRPVVVVARVVKAPGIFAHHAELVMHAGDLRRLGPKGPLGQAKRLVKQLVGLVVATVSAGESAAGLESACSQPVVAPGVWCGRWVDGMAEGGRGFTGLIGRPSRRRSFGAIVPAGSMRGRSGSGIKRLRHRRPARSSGSPLGRSFQRAT